MKAIFLGILASFFFASTFVLNRAMNLSGDSWIWSAVLRYVFMVPPLLGIVVLQGNLKPLLRDLLKRPRLWIIWSTVGFGFFYAPLCFASAYGPAWLVASMWQLTIIAGSLLAPLFNYEILTKEGPKKIRAKIPYEGLKISLIILLGVVIIQVQQVRQLTIDEVLLGVIPVVVAAFAYPLGNRKMMETCSNKLNTFQRVLGMTIASLPFWLIMALFGYKTVGLPSTSQVQQSLVVALFSGVIATVLFFSATEIAKGDLSQLAGVEATQSGEIIFSILGEVLILKGSYPSFLSYIGILLVILGMIMHSFIQHKSQKNISNLNV